MERGLVSVAGTATGYRLDGPWIESRWRRPRFSAPVQTGPGAHLAMSEPHSGYCVFPGGKVRPGRDADPLPPSSSVVKKE